MSDPASLLQQVTASAVHEITLRSQITPTFSYSPPAEPSEPEPDRPPSLLLRLIKPEVTIDTVAGPYVIAPYGPPERNLTPVFLIAGGFMLFGIYSFARWAIGR